MNTLNQVDYFNAVDAIIADHLDRLEGQSIAPAARCLAEVERRYRRETWGLCPLEDGRMLDDAESRRSNIDHILMSEGTDLTPKDRSALEVSCVVASRCWPPLFFSPH